MSDTDRASLIEAKRKLYLEIKAIDADDLSLSEIELGYNLALDEDIQELLERGRVRELLHSSASESI